MKIIKVIHFFFSTDEESEPLRNKCTPLKQEVIFLMYNSDYNFSYCVHRVKYSVWLEANAQWVSFEQIGPGVLTATPYQQP